VSRDGLSRIERVLLVGHDNPGSARLFERVVGAFPGVRFGLVIGQGLYYGRSFAASVVKLLREASWTFVVHRCLDLCRHRLRGASLRQHASRLGVPVLCTADINAEPALGWIRGFAPDLLVSLFTMQLYRRTALEIPRFGAIGTHPALLPRYRGLEVFFWVLANGEKETGVSGYFLSERVDDGPIFEQRVVPITPATTVDSLYREITEIGADVLIRGIRDIDAGTVRRLPQAGEASYYRMPDRAAMRRFRRLGRRLR
jgi:methionyl-tRNA formyltransferase